jgi:hypothetical protein
MSKPRRSNRARIIKLKARPPAVKNHRHRGHDSLTGLVSREFTMPPTNVGTNVSHDSLTH